MPRDRRTLTFNSGELKQALFEFCRATNRQPPDATFEGFRVFDGDQVMATVAGASSSGIITFIEHEIAAALIMYCRSNGIPLPRSARKSLIAEGEECVSLSLVGERS